MADCSFLEQGHPDVNMENNPWPESHKGKVWAAKGKSLLTGSIKFFGAPFDYVMFKK